MPHPSPPPYRRPAARILAGLAALIGMLALVVAVPIVLVTAWHSLGPPLPSPHDLASTDNGTVFVRTLCLVGWLAWVSFTWAGFAEILAQWRGWRLPAVGWQRRLAADLIATIVVLLSSPSIVSSAATPLAVPVATAVHSPDVAGVPSPAARPAPAQGGRATYLEHQVLAGEQMPALAERYLGDKYRWQAIAAATYGLPQPDGRTLRPGDTRIYPGWTVRIPATGIQLASSTTRTTPDPAPARSTVSQDAAAQEPVEYRASEGDWIWYVAERFLGDPDRYPEIAALNPHLVSKYGATFPDHIEPGDILRLPAHARDRGPRHHATGTTTEITAHHASPDAPPADPRPAAPATIAQPPAPATVTPAPGTPAASVTGRTTGPVPDTSTGSATAPTATTSAAPTDHTVQQGSAPTHPSAAADHPGIDLGARGWVSADLAGAVASAAALVWIQRRRRYRPRRPGPTARHDPDLTPMPATVAALHGARPTSTIEDDMDDPEPHARAAATVTHASLGAHPTGRTMRLSDLPALGIGWTGPGAENAARGLIASLLSSGGAWAPAAEATLLTTHQILAGLLPRIETAGADPDRLQAHDTLDQTLDELERQLLRRARLAADPDANSDSDSGEPELAPMVLLASAPTQSTATRLAAILTVGSRLAISAVLLGDWPIGGTWHVSPDGAATADQNQDPAAAVRLNLLDETGVMEILDTLRQARSDTPDPAPARPPALPAQPVARIAPVRTTPMPGPPADAATPNPSTTAGRNGLTPRTDAPLQLLVLGRPTARTTTGSTPGALRIRRSDGVALLVHLAVEPAGATSDELMALLWPDIRPQHSRRRFHTTLSELRHTLNDAIGDDPVQRTQDRYHLNPALVDVDLWNLLAAVDRAATAVDPVHHHTALHDVIRLYTGPVAEGHTWLWLDTYRETVRRHVLDAYTALAETEPDPRTALTLVQDAIRIDPYNENLYQQAMHLHARLGSPDGIRRALRTITQRLNELDIPVSAATQNVASQLLERQTARERLRHPTT